MNLFDWRMWLLVLLIFLLGGCLWGNPGGEVRRGMTQTQTVGWGADGNFTQTAEGTQTNNLLMAEGLIVMKDGNGMPAIDFDQSRLTHVLITSPSARDASNALARAFEASTAQAEMFGKTLEGILSMVVPLIQSRMERPREPDAESDRLSRDDVLEIIRELRGETP